MVVCFNGVSSPKTVSVSSVKMLVGKRICTVQEGERFDRQDESRLKIV